MDKREFIMQWMLARAACAPKPDDKCWARRLAEYASDLYDAAFEVTVEKGSD